MKLLKGKEWEGLRLKGLKKNTESRKEGNREKRKKKREIFKGYEV